MFKSFFIHKILVHPKKSEKKSEKTEKIRKNLQKSEKNPINFKDFFEDLKSVHPILEWTTQPLSLLNYSNIQSIN